MSSGSARLRVTVYRQEGERRGVEERGGGTGTLTSDSAAVATGAICAASLVLEAQPIQHTCIARAHLALNLFYFGEQVNLLGAASPVGAGQGGKKSHAVRCGGVRQRPQKLTGRRGGAAPVQPLKPLLTHSKTSPGFSSLSMLQGGSEVAPGGGGDGCGAGGGWVGYRRERGA